MEILKIGQKFIFKENERVKQSSDRMVTIPAGTEGYVAGNGYIIVTDGITPGSGFRLTTASTG